MPKLPYHIRAVAAGVLITFTLTQNVSAQSIQSAPASSVLPEFELGTKFSIPKNLGAVEKFKAPEDGAGFVILIQDAHAVIDAQIKIHRLIQYIAQKHHVSLVGVEGGTGPMDTMLLKSFPDYFIKAKVMRDYLERGELNGSGIASIFDKEPVRFEGIEDWQHYAAHIRVYREAMTQNGEWLKKFQKDRVRLDRERKKIYPEDVNVLHEKIDAFYQEKMSFFDFLRFLSVWSREHGAEPGADGRESELSKLLGSIKVQASEEKEKPEITLRRMAETFKRRKLVNLKAGDQAAFNQSFQAFNSAQKDAGSFLDDFLKAAQKAGIRLKLTPGLQSLAERTRTLSAIKGTQVFEELEVFLQSLSDRFLTTPEQKSIAAQYRNIELLEAFVKLELSRKQWGEIQADREWRNKNGKSLLPDTFYKFYELAEQRDRVLYEKLQAAMKKQKAKAAIVVVGGFHTEGLQAFFEKDRGGYAVIMPRIRTLEGKEQYSDEMTGNFSYKKYLRDSFFEAFMRHATAQLASEVDYRRFKQTLIQWREEVIRNLSAQGRIDQAGFYTRYIDVLFKRYLEKYGMPEKMPSKDEILETLRGEISSISKDSASTVFERIETRTKSLVEGIKALQAEEKISPEALIKLFTGSPAQTKTANVPQVIGLFPAAGTPESIETATPGEFEAGPEVTVSQKPVTESMRHEIRDVVPLSMKDGRLEPAPEIEKSNELQNALDFLNKIVDHNTFKREGWGNSITGLKLEDEDNGIDFTEGVLTISTYALKSSAENLKKSVEDKLFFQLPGTKSILIQIVKQQDPGLTAEEAETLAEDLPKVLSRIYKIYHQLPGDRDDLEYDEAQWTMALSKFEEFQGDSRLPKPRLEKVKLILSAKKYSQKALTEIVEEVDIFYDIQREIGKVLNYRTDRSLDTVLELRRFSEGLREFLKFLKENPAEYGRWISSLSKLHKTAHHGSKITDDTPAIQAILADIMPHLFKLYGAKGFRKDLPVLIEGITEITKGLPKDLSKQYFKGLAAFFETYQGDPASFLEGARIIRNILEIQGRMSKEPAQVYWELNFENKNFENAINLLQTYELIVRLGIRYNRELDHHFQDYADAVTAGEESLRAIPVFTKNADGQWVVSAANESEIARLEIFRAWLSQILRREVSYTINQGVAELTIGNLWREESAEIAFDETPVLANSGSGWKDDNHDRKAVETPALDNTKDAANTIGILAKAREFLDTKRRRESAVSSGPLSEAMILEDLLYFAKMYDGLSAARFFQEVEQRIGTRTSSPDRNIDSRYVLKLTRLGEAMLEAGFIEDGDRVLNRAYQYLQQALSLPKEEAPLSQNRRDQNKVILESMLRIAKIFAMNHRGKEAVNLFRYVVNFDTEFLSAPFLEEDSVAKIVTALWDEFQKTRSPELLTQLQEIVEAWETRIPPAFRTTHSVLSDLLPVYQQIAASTDSETGVLTEFLRTRIRELYEMLLGREMLKLSNGFNSPYKAFESEINMEKLHNSLVDYLALTVPGKKITVGEHVIDFSARTVGVKTITEFENDVEVVFSIKISEKGDTVDYSIRISREQYQQLIPPVFNGKPLAQQTNFLRDHWAWEHLTGNMDKTKKTATFEEGFKDSNENDAVLKETIQAMIESDVNFLPLIMKKIQNDFWPSLYQLEIMSWIWDRYGEQMDVNQRKEFFDRWDASIQAAAESQLLELQFDGLRMKHQSRHQSFTLRLTRAYLENRRRLDAAKLKSGMITEDQIAEHVSEIMNDQSALVAQSGSGRDRVEIPAEKKFLDRTEKDERERSEAFRESLADVKDGLPEAVKKVFSEEEKKEDARNLDFIHPDVIELQYLLTVEQSLASDGDLSVKTPEVYGKFLGAARRVLESLPAYLTAGEIWFESGLDASKINEKNEQHAKFAFEILEDAIRLLIDNGQIEDAKMLLGQLAELKKSFTKMESLIRKDADAGKSVLSDENKRRKENLEALKKFYSRGLLLGTIALAKKLEQMNRKEEARELIAATNKQILDNVEAFSGPYLVYYVDDMSSLEGTGNEIEPVLSFLIERLHLTEKDPEIEVQAKVLDKTFNLTRAIHKSHLSPPQREALLGKLFDRVVREIQPSSAQPTLDEQYRYMSLQVLSLLYLYKAVHESADYPSLKSRVLEHFYKKTRGLHFEENLAGSVQSSLLFSAIKKLAQISAEAHPDMARESIVSEVLSVSENFQDLSAVQEQLSTLFPEALKEHFSGVEPESFFQNYSGQPEEITVMNYFKSEITAVRAASNLRDALLSRIKKDLASGKIIDSRLLDLAQGFIANEIEAAMTVKMTKSSRGRAFIQLDPGALRDASQTDSYGPVWDLFAKEVEKRGQPQDPVRTQLLETLLFTSSQEQVFHAAELYQDLFLLPNLSDEEKEKIFFKILQTRFSRSNSDRDRILETLNSYYMREIQYDDWPNYEPEAARSLKAKTLKTRTVFLRDFTKFLSLERRAAALRKKANQWDREGILGIRTNELSYFENSYYLIPYYLQASEQGTGGDFFDTLERVLDEIEVNLQSDYDKGTGASAESKSTPYIDPLDPDKSFLRFLLERTSNDGRFGNLRQVQGSMDNYVAYALKTLDGMDMDASQRERLKAKWKTLGQIDVFLAKDFQELDSFLRRAPSLELSDPRSPYHTVFRMRFSQLSPMRRAKILKDLQDEKFSDLFSMPEVMRRTIVQAGVGDIKAGQILSNNEDLVPDAGYRAELAKLKSNVPAIPFEAPTDKEIEKSVGEGNYKERPHEQNFSIEEAVSEAFPGAATPILVTMEGKGILADNTREEVDLNSIQRQEGVVFYRFWKNPMGVASIGQVHRAVIWDEQAGKPRDVVVKIIKPNAPGEVREGREGWLEIAKAAEENPERFPGIRNPILHVETIFNEIEEELNLLSEADNIELMGTVVDGEKTRVTEVFRQYSRPTILVLSFAEKVPISDTPQRMRQQAASDYMNMMTEHIFQKGTYHADPHDKNVYIDEQGRLTLIDLGMTGHLDAASRDRLFELMFRVYQKDVSLIFEAMKSIADFPDDFEAQEFQNGIQAIVSQKDLPLTKKIQKILELATKKGAKVHSEFTIVVKTILTAEGVVNKLDPGYDSLEAFIPVILGYVWQRTAWDEKMAILSSLAGESFAKKDDFVKKVLPEIWKHSSAEDRRRILKMGFGGLDLEDMGGVLGGGGAARAVGKLGQVNTAAEGFEAGLGLMEAATQFFTAGGMSAENAAGKIQTLADGTELLERIRSLFPEVFPEIWNLTPAKEKADLTRILLANPSLSIQQIENYVGLILEQGDKAEAQKILVQVLADPESAVKLLGLLQGMSPEFLEKMRGILAHLFADRSPQAVEIFSNLVRDEKTRSLLLDFMFGRVLGVLSPAMREALIQWVIPILKAAEQAGLFPQLAEKFFAGLDSSEKTNLMAAAAWLLVKNPKMIPAFLNVFWNQTSAAEKFKVLGKAALFPFGMFRAPADQPAAKTQPKKAAPKQAPTPAQKVPEAAAPESTGTGYFNVRYEKTPDASLSFERSIQLEKSFSEEKIVTSMDDIEEIITILKEVSPLGRFLIQELEKRNIPITVDMMPNAFGNLFETVLDRNHKNIIWIGFAPGVTFQEAFHHVIHELVHAMPLIQGVDYPSLTEAEVKSSNEKELQARILDIMAFEEALAFSSNLELQKELFSHFPVPDDGKEITWEDVWPEDSQEDMKFTPAIVRLWEKTIREEGFAGFAARMRKYYPMFRENLSLMGTTSYPAMAAQMAKQLKESQDDLSALTGLSKTQSKLGKKIRAINQFSALKSLTRNLSLKPEGEKRYFDKKTLRRLAESDEVDKLLNDLTEDLDLDDVPELLNMVAPMMTAIPMGGEIVEVMRSETQAVITEQLKKMLGPLNTPAAKKVLIGLIGGEIRKGLNRQMKLLEGLADGERGAVRGVFDQVEEAGKLMLERQKEIIGTLKEVAGAIQGQPVENVEIQKAFDFVLARFGNFQSVGNESPETESAGPRNEIRTQSSPEESFDKEAYFRASAARFMAALRRERSPEGGYQNLSLQQMRLFLEAERDGKLVEVDPQVRDFWERYNGPRKVIEKDLYNALLDRLAYQPDENVIMDKAVEAILNAGITPVNAVAGLRELNKKPDEDTADEMLSGPVYRVLMPVFSREYPQGAPPDPTRFISGVIEKIQARAEFREYHQALAQDIVNRLAQGDEKLENLIPAVIKENRARLEQSIGKELTDQVLGAEVAASDAASIIDSVLNLDPETLQPRFAEKFGPWFDVNDAVLRLQGALAARILASGLIADAQAAQTAARALLPEMIRAAQFLLAPENREVLRAAIQERFGEDVNFSEHPNVILGLGLLQDQDKKVVRNSLEDLAARGNAGIAYQVGLDKILREFLMPGVVAYRYSDQHPLKPQRGESPELILAPGTPLAALDSAAQGYQIQPALVQTTQLTPSGLVTLGDLLKAEFLKGKLVQSGRDALPTVTEKVLIEIFGILRDLMTTQAAQKAAARAA